ncbi:MAG TPA: hypothetical protein VGK67_40310 [Myxococcales bacterium]|jgi:hypothetical protein
MKKQPQRTAPKAGKKSKKPAPKTFRATARIWEPIMPIERGERYEDPLNRALRRAKLGLVEGGGTMLGEDREIEFVDVEMVVRDVDGVIERVCELLDECGAPRGSELSFEKDGEQQVVAFGKAEGVAIYLDGVNLPKQVYESTDINVLADKLTAAMKGKGEIRGSWPGPEETSFYLYGANADRLFASIEKVLRTYPLCQNARVVIRNGRSSLKPKTVRIKQAKLAAKKPVKRPRS